MDDMHRILHAIAIKKHGSLAAVAALSGLPEAGARKVIEGAVAGGRVREANGRYLLAPLARVLVEAEYSGVYADVRADSAFLDAYEAFERLNLGLKALMTDWQTMEVGGQRVANDHSNPDYDHRILDRLGDCHEQVEAILRRLERAVPRLSYYREHLLAALEKAEDGQAEWVSDARIESYHTIWFELHEDLLRITGRTRKE